MRPTRRLLLSICVVVMASVAACAKGEREPEPLPDGAHPPASETPTEDSERQDK